MSLASVERYFPSSIRTAHPRRVANYLTYLDDQLEEPVTLTVYGSAAVSLYLADDEDYERGYTKDIDIGRMIPDSVEVELESGAVEPPLTLQTFPVENWLVHPDWTEDTVAVGGLLTTESLTVELLHPVDLIITKLERFHPQDVEDGIFLRERYVHETETVVERLREAWSYYLSSKRAKSQIEAAFESIFEVECPLE